MTHRQHLIIDAIGQALILIFYSMLMSKSEAPIAVLQLLPIVLSAWQFVNGVLSYKFFERSSKKLYVRVCGITWITIFGFWGILWFLGNIGLMAVAVGSIAYGAIDVMWILLPVVLAVMAGWYIYITIRDIYIMLYHTI